MNGIGFRLAALAACIAAGASGGAVAQPYDACMALCVPEKGFYSCNTKADYCAEMYASYGTCMAYCVPEKGFYRCNTKTDYCGAAGDASYETCMHYCEPEKGFYTCNNREDHCDWAY